MEGGILRASAGQASCEVQQTLLTPPESFSWGCGNVGRVTPGTFNPRSSWGQPTEQTPASYLSRVLDQGHFSRCWIGWGFGNPRLERPGQLGQWGALGGGCGGRWDSSCSPTGTDMF